MQGCYDTPPLLSRSPATCGNGAVDPGEVCDDGNRVGGDGCNAWCSGFDRLSATCTMAGAGATCPGGAPILDTPSKSVFCDLTAIAVRNNTLFLADGGVLIRYDVLDTPTPLRAFAATPPRRFVNVQSNLCA